MRLMGVKAGKHVAMALQATVDIFYPELIEIGDNAVISACSLVNSDVPEGSFVGGVPARVIERKNIDQDH